MGHANKMQIEQKKTAALFSKLFYIQGKEIGNKKYYAETREFKNCQSEILPVRQRRRRRKSHGAMQSKQKLLL